MNVIVVLTAFDRIAAAMTEVARYDVDELGKPRPVYAMSETAQLHSRHRLAELSYRIGLLVTPEGGHGIEAQRRLDRALVASVEARKAHCVHPFGPARIDVRREA